MQESTSFARVAITAAFICTGVFSAAIAHVSAADCSQNSAPVARVGDDIVMTREDTAHFDASASYDANGDPLSYRWDFDADRKSTRLNSSHSSTSYAVFCFKK